MIMEALLLALLTGTDKAPPVARVLEVKGSAELQASEGKARPARHYATVYLNDKLTVKPEAQVVVGFRSDGHLERVTRPGSYVVKETRLDPQEGVELAEAPRAARNVVVGTFKPLPVFPKGATLVARGIKSKVHPPEVAPLMGTTVAAARPTFRWPALAGAGTYEIAVYLGSRTIWSATTKQTQLEFPADQPPLKSGGTYQWEVNAVLGDQSHKLVVDGEFNVATQDQATQLAELEPLADSSDPAIVALAAMRYEQLGAVDEALELYERLTQQTPNVGPFQAALARLYAKVGRKEKAAKAAARAKELGVPESELAGD